MRQRTLTLALAVCLLFGIAGCQKKENSVPEDIPQAVTVPDEDSEALVATDSDIPLKSPEEAKLLVTVENVEISLADLKAQDYTVPVLVTLERNPGINYSEWGVYVDSHCTFASKNHPLGFSTVFAENPENHFIWTAWSSGNEVRTDTGILLQIDLTLPMDAAPGDFYPVTYAYTSLAPKPHVWGNGTDNWAALGEAVGVDGGVTVTE